MHRCNRHPRRKQCALLLVHLERHVRFFGLRVLKRNCLDGFVDRFLFVLFVALLVHRLLFRLRFRFTRVGNHLRDSDCNLAQLMQDEFGLRLRRLIFNLNLSNWDWLKFHHRHENDLLDLVILFGRIVESFDVVLLLVLDGIGVLLDVLGLVGVWVLWIWGLLIAP